VLGGGRLDRGGTSGSLLSQLIRTSVLLARLPWRVASIQCRSGESVEIIDPCSYLHALMSVVHHHVPSSQLFYVGLY
jgi:hypothetical protein